MTDERALLMCSPIAWTPVPTFDADLAACDTCHNGVWVSRTLYRRVANGELVPVCLECMPAAARNGIDARLHPDQEGELAEAGILDDARALVALLNLIHGKTDAG